jgi:membrane glycosyltransferase
LRLLVMAGLRPVSRFQLLWAILMFIGIPAWTLLMAVTPVAALLAGDVRADWLAGLYWVFLLMYLAPKLAGYVHTVASRHRRARYGGLWRFVAGAGSEIVFSLLQTSVTSLHVTGFIVTLLAGRSVRWVAPARDGRPVGWGEAARAFWPQTVFGVLLHGGLAVAAPALLVWAAPFTLGYLVAIPFAVLTAQAWRFGLWSIPEECCVPPEVGLVMRRRHAGGV